MIRWDRTHCQQKVCVCHDDTAPAYSCGWCGCQPGVPLTAADIRCPECGELARGTIETVNGVAEFVIEEDGTVDYSGRTDIWWDEQMTVMFEGRCMLICRSGHEWSIPPRPPVWAPPRRQGIAP